MMGSDCCVRIERFDNGFTVEIKDPAIVKANSKPDKKDGPYTPYKEPWKTFVFKTDAEVITFLTKNLKKAIASSKDKDEYGTAFDMAAEDDGDD